MINNIGNKNVPSNINMLKGVAFLSGATLLTALVSKTYSIIRKFGSKNELTFKNMADYLEEEIRKSSKVFIVGHNNPDLDSIGSAMGLQQYATSCGKKAYIIVDDDQSKIEPGTKKVIDENKIKYRIINKSEFQRIKDDNSLLIMTDVNKSNMISVGDCLDAFKSIFIIDHHSTNENTVQAKYIYTNENDSSSSEIVSRLLHKKRIKPRKEVATVLLAGISLDTQRFKQNTTPITHEAAKMLISKGADKEYVNNLFLQDFETHCRIQELIINGTKIYRLNESSLSPIYGSFTFNRRKPQGPRPIEDYAKIADQMLTFAGIDAAFAMGYVEPGVVHVSARGNKGVNVGRIMDAIGGGGNAQSAGAKIETSNIEDVERQLLEIAKQVVGEREEVLEQPRVVKVKQKIFPIRNKYS